MTPMSIDFLRYVYELSAVGVWWRDVRTHKYLCKIDWESCPPLVMTKKPDDKEWTDHPGLFEKLAAPIRKQHPELWFV